MGRIIVGLLAGLATVILAVGAIDYAAHQLMPLRSDAAPMPLSIQLLVLAAYFAGTLLGALVAMRIALRGWTSWAIAALVAAGAVWSMFIIPHPQWLQVAAVVVPFVGAAAARHVPRRTAAS